MEKTRLLFYGDSPTGNTGFGVVAKNILAQLHATGKYDISVLGINFYGDPDEALKCPDYKIYPAGVNNQGDVYGRQRLLDLLRNKNNEFDMLFTLQDTFIMASIGKAIKDLRDGYIKEKDGKKIFVKGRNFKWIYYYPIDAVPEKEWLEKSVKFADMAVPYTNYAKAKSLACVERDYPVIYHGVDTKTFFPMAQEEKEKFAEEFFKDNNLKNHFLIVNVNRNQERKALMYTLLAFKLFRTLVPHSVLYTHCDVVGDRGGNLMKIAARLGITENWLYPNPETYNQGKAYSSEFLNGIYNLANINVSTTLGEGWGLSCTESMACKTLNVFPDNTSLTEILGEERGLLYKSGNPPTQVLMNGPLDNSLLRPMPNVEDMVEKMLWVYSHPDAAHEIEEKAYSWILENITWENIGSQWDQLIDKLLQK